MAGYKPGQIHVAGRSLLYNVTFVYSHADRKESEEHGDVLIPQIGSRIQFSDVSTICYPVEQVFYDYLSSGRTQVFVLLGTGYLR